MPSTEYGSLWGDLREFVIPSGVTGILFLLGAGSLFLVALCRNSTQLYMMTVLWIVVVGAVYASFQVGWTFGGNVEYLNYIGPWEMVFVFSGYGVRTFTMLVIAVPFICRSLPPTTKEIGFVLGPMLSVFLLLSFDCLTLGMVRQRMTESHEAQQGVGLDAE